MLEKKKQNKQNKNPHLNMSNPITNANIPTFPDWHSRGYLPHVENKQLQMVTFRLYDSIPKAILNKWKENVIAESNIDVINKLQRNNVRDIGVLTF